ncbi:MAG: maleylpyruvate isomerase family mycothiol-dependent enzyme [Arachnia sp.]
MATTKDQELTGLARDERADLAEFLRGLTPQEWDAQSLCSQWRVRDVVAHVISYDVLSPVQLVGRFLHGALPGNSPNAIGVELSRALGHDELLHRIESHLTPTGLTTGFHGAIGLTDAVIHHQDIRRPLGRPRHIPEERLRPALDFALRSPKLPAKYLVQGLRLAATDLDWSSGEGPEVRGSGEALLMVIAGRRGVATELTGQGVPVLAGRLESQNR